MDCSSGTWPKFATTGDSRDLDMNSQDTKRPKIGSQLGYPNLEQMGHWCLVETDSSLPPPLLLAEGWEIGWEANVLNPFLTYSDIQIHHIISYTQITNVHMHPYMSQFVLLVNS